MEIFLESQDSIMTMNKDGLFEIHHKTRIERNLYEPINNTLDESTKRYLKYAKTWREYMGPYCSFDDVSRQS